jgi:NitT/TauT family transport system substrate-binding protein
MDRRAALASIVGLASACKRRSSSGDRLKLQLNWVPEPEFGGLYAARDGGHFRERGLEVEISGGAAGTPVLQLVATAQADFGVSAADDVVIARARGLDVVAVFATFQTSPLGIMVHRARGLSRIEDLASGTLAVELGLPFATWLTKKYALAGVTVVPYDGGIAKFLADPNHAQQCYVTSEPIAARRKGSDPQVFTAKSTGFDPYTNVLVTRGEIARAGGPRLEGFLAAVGAGWRSYLADPAPANETMAALNRAMDRATFDEAAAVQAPLVRGDLPEGSLGAMNEERFAALAEQLLSIGTIDRAPRARDCMR